MKTNLAVQARSKMGWSLLRILICIGCWFASPTPMQAQYPGDNAVCLSSTCGSTNVTNSHSFIDASQMAGTDVCTKINAALKNLVNSGGSTPLYNKRGTIDARGVSASTLDCTGSQASPWDGFNVNGSLKPPKATILLPAGTIKISKAWVLPEFTRVIGEGSCLSSTNCNLLTTIQAQSGLTTMIQLGNNILCSPNSHSIYDCQATVIEHVRLDANSVASLQQAILNNFAEELSYVNDVAIVNLASGGVGLSLGSSSSNNANNSGPYSNIYVSGNAATCVTINGTNGTRGIHGLTCYESAGTGVAIKLDAPNNTLEDISIVTGIGTGAGSFQDGILIGSVASAENNVISNVTGVDNVTNLIHICGPTGHVNCPSSSSTPPKDLSILAVTNSGGTTIYDELMGTTLRDSYVGMYLVGEPVVAGAVNGFTRFTTSASVPTWFEGPDAPATNPGFCPIGSLYSRNTGSGTTLWGCVNVGGSPSWQPIM
jgi:hypothetical protein